MLTFQTLTLDAIPGRLRAEQEKFWHLRPLDCSAHNSSRSKKVYIISVPARSPNVFKYNQDTLQPPAVNDATAKNRFGLRTDTRSHTYDIHFLWTAAVVGTIAQ